MIGESYRQRQSTPDELRERYANNAILGMEDAVDPETGDRFRVGSGSNCYWIDDRGRIVETEVETRPGWILGRWCGLDKQGAWRMEPIRVGWNEKSNNWRNHSLQRLRAVYV